MSEVNTDLHQLVEQVLREELAHLSTEFQRSANEANSVTIIERMVPIIHESVLEAVRLGIALGRGEESALVALSASAEADVKQVQPATSVEQLSQVAPTTEVPQEPEDASDMQASVIFNGTTTLVASPFEKFVEVQRFQRLLERIPRISSVKPKRFVGGRLILIIETEFADTRSLADTLLTELALFRPTLRTMQGDLIELILKPIISTEETAQNQANP